MCRLGCVSARLETSQHLPWICCDQNCCFPASRQLSELPWGGAGIAVGVLGGSFGHCWGCAGCPCCFQLLGVMSVLDLSGSWWPCMVSSCVAREHFPLCCLSFSLVLCVSHPMVSHPAAAWGLQWGTVGRGGESSVPCRVSAPQNAGSFGPSWQHLCMQCIRARSSLRH